MATDDHSRLWAEVRRLGELTANHDSRLKELEDHDEDHEERLRVSEERRFPLNTVSVIIGALSLVVAVSAVVVAILAM